MKIRPLYVAAAGVIGAAALIRFDSEEEVSMQSPGQCPICGETVDPRGLNGHLRFGYDLDPDEARQLTSSGEAMEVSTG